MELTKLGPIVPASYPRVTFRIAGQQEVRQYIPSFQNNNYYGIIPTLQEAVYACEQFIDTRCRPFLRLDGYKPEDRSFIGHQVISSEVDFFYSDHPLVKA